MPEYKMKPYEELDITDNFMFAKVFSNVDVAKDFLQDVLKISIEKITVVSEATTQEDPFHKSVRFDVQVREEFTDAVGKRHIGRYFDVELQMENTGELPKRARYYQSIHNLVEKYRLDPVARKAYMTLEQELNIRYKKGLKEGREEGREEGRSEGADFKNKELAKGFRDDGVSIEVIAKRTGLSPEEIKAL